ncbi:hypothetical protein SNE40_016094 [Patella caerulea]|uniref:Uncharacterized protein n=1 Tax=Patella caerulea TaxID=87958 RepID=A0AAN8J8P6_PATCE
MSSSTAYQNILLTLFICILGFAFSAPDTTDNAEVGAHENGGQLAYILAKRSSQMPLIPPPNIYQKRFSTFFNRQAENKRAGDGYWIWMPAHGYMAVPRDEAMEDAGGRDGMNNLLRYGKK